MGCLSGVAKMAWDVMSGVTKTAWDVMSGGDKHSMGCFVRGGKSLWDALSGVSKNGMGCFVLGCFVQLPPYTVIQNLGPFHIFMSPPQGSIDILFSPRVCLAVCLTFRHTVFFRHCLTKNLTPFSDPIITWSEHHYTH